jgi:mRNA (guanine-N7-)-methyltransferase
MDHDDQDNDDETRRAQDVATHYNARPELGRDGRQKSDVFQLKALNNWIKSVLIAEATYETRAQRVLDLCCGKGGDLVKWTKVPSLKNLVGVDIADVSVKQATERFKAMRFVNYSANFLAADVFAVCIVFWYCG